MSDKVHLGHRARKRFGQNFLHDESVIGQIVASIHPKPGQNLVEIGPGLGALTEPVCEAAEVLQVVELDRDLAERLRHHPFLGNKLTIHEADAMQFDFSPLAEKGKLRIFGNLPYNISTPLLFHLFSFSEQVEDMHFMLQKEVVQRMAAEPGSKSYGRLSVMTQYYCDVVSVLTIGPGAFKPAPKVDSAVARLNPRPFPIKAKSTKVLNQVCLEAFNQRRKTLRNCLKNLITEEELEQLDIKPTLRPEKLSVSDFIKIANWVVDNPKIQKVDNA